MCLRFLLVYNKNNLLPSLFQNANAVAAAFLLILETRSIDAGWNLSANLFYRRGMRFPFLFFFSSQRVFVSFFLSKQPVETSRPCRETRITRTSTPMSRSSSSSYKTSRNRWSCKYWAVCFRMNRSGPDVFAPCLPADHVSGVPGPAEEHDLHVRPRHLSALWGPNERVPHLPKGHRAPHPPLLDPFELIGDPSPF